MPSGRDFLVAAALVLLYDTWPVAAEEPRTGAAQIEQLPPIVVIDTTPVPALGTPIEKYAGNVQSIGTTEIENQNLLDIPDLLSRNLGSVNITGNQGNPWQTDLTYRGFLASPLTGTPIGLSMYLDGMRFNDGFGDTINWDLIPQSAIADIDVIPGSNPLFGLNTLGGALAVHTKRGFDYPGVEARSVGGLLRALERQRGIRRVPGAARLVSHLQCPRRGRLARSLAQRPAPALREGRLPD